MATKKHAGKSSSKSKPSVSRKATPVSKPFSKTEILTAIAEYATLTKKQVSLVLDGLTHVIERHMKKGATGVFVLPGLLKMQLINKPATKARKGTNPFTGEEIIFKAKPARHVVKVRALKKLKDMA